MPRCACCADWPCGARRRAIGIGRSGRQGRLQVALAWLLPKALLFFAWVFLPVQTNPNARTHAVRVLTLTFASTQFMVRCIPACAVLAALPNGLAATTQRR